MTDYDRLLAIKKAAQVRLFQIPGVHAVGVGPKFVGGKRTNDISITVFVLEKRPLGDLPAEHAIPPEIEGIKTDVVARPPPRLLAGATLPDTATARPLSGGIAIKPGGAFGGGGTLGCLAVTNGPEPRVVALTCWHVVADPQFAPTSLTVGPSGGAMKFSGTNVPGTLVVVEFSLPPGARARGAFYTTSDVDTTASIAAGVNIAISDLALSGVNSSVSGDEVTIGVPSGTSPPEIRLFGPRASDAKAKLHATVFSPDELTHVITLTGRPADGQGLFTGIDPGGAQVSFGVFTAPGKNLAIRGIVEKMADSLRSVVAELGLTGITVTTATETVTVNGVEAVRCEITNDIRVGQPDNRFGCSTSWCTNNRIGRVLDARADVDAAIIEIDPGMKYLAEIKELGVVQGFHPVDDTEVFPGHEYPVKKRGMMTGATEGTILRLHVDGFIPLGSTRPFGRQYHEAMEIVSGLDVFADGGDSGSAIVSASPGDEGKVVGLLFGAGESLFGATFAMAMPIKGITDALKITLETATVAQAGIARTAPTFVGSPMSILDEEDALGPASLAGRPSAALRDRLMVVGQEVSASPVGEEIATAVQRHIPETQDLINGHRRVGAVWRRNGGTRIIQGFLEMLEAPPERATTLPATINERPLGECFRRIYKVLLRYGSAAFRADLQRLGPLVLESCGLTYQQMLVALSAAGAGSAAAPGMTFVEAEVH